jgi:hypothetical protein
VFQRFSESPSLSDGNRLKKRRRAGETEEEEEENGEEKLEQQIRTK